MTAPLTTEMMEPELGRSTGALVQNTTRFKITCKEYRFFLFFIATVILSSVITYTGRDVLPSPIDASTADLNGKFSGVRAYANLKNIANQAHPVLSVGNRLVYNSLGQQLLNLQSLATKNNMILDVNYVPINNTGASDELNATQLVAILQGKSNNSLLLSSHFDSYDVSGYSNISVCLGGCFYSNVGGSYGATDDGAGVTVSLEVLYNIINTGKKPEFSLMIFLNNGEELGLLGSDWMVKSKYWSRVISFINLEGGGTGGKSILFRGNDFYLINAYKNHAPHPHLNVFGQSVMEAIGSETDYSVYSSPNRNGNQGVTPILASQSGVKGIDIAFYENRGNYHTIRDNLANIGPESVQQMGDNVLAVVKSAIFDPNFKPIDGDGVYYDFLCTSAVVYSFATKRTVGIIFLILSLVCVIFMVVKLNVKYSRLLKFAFGFFFYILICAIASIVLGVHTWILLAATFTGGFAFSWANQLSGFIASTLLNILLIRLFKLTKEDHALISASALLFSSFLLLIFEICFDVGLTYIFLYLNVLMLAANLPIIVGHYYSKFQQFVPYVSLLVSYPIVMVILLHFSIMAERVSSNCLFSLPIAGIIHSLIGLVALPYFLYFENWKKLTIGILAFDLVVFALCLVIGFAKFH